MDEGTQKEVNEAKSRWDECYSHNRDLILRTEGGLNALVSLVEKRIKVEPDLAGLHNSLPWLQTIMIFETNMLDANNDQWKLIARLSKIVDEQESDIGKIKASLGVLTKILDLYKPVLDEVEKDYKDKLGRIQS